MTADVKISQGSSPDDDDVRPGPVSRKKAQERTQRVLEIALEEFLEKGYDGANMREVARRSRVSKRTIYQICADKRELFVMVAQNSMAGLQAALDFELHKDRPIRDVLQKVAELWIGSMVDSPMHSLTWLIVGEVRRFPELGKMALENIRQLRAPLGDYLLGKSKPGSLTPKQASWMADHFLTMLRGGISGYFEPADEFFANQEERIQSVLDTFLLAFPARD